ncbi:MAG: phosphatidate cytidylyltransferase [Anaerolineae bacterium]
MTTVTNSEDLKQSGQPDEQPTRKKPRQLSNLLVRFLTGMLILPVVLIVIFLGGWFLTLTLMLIMLVAILEFYFMEKRRGLQNNALLGVVAALMVILAFHYNEPLLWQVAVISTIIITFVVEFGRGREVKPSLARILTTIGGIFYIAFPLSFLVAIRDGVSGYHWFFAYIYCTWGTDTFAYLVGSRFGRIKFAPILSPKKTIEGAVGGIVAGSLLPLAVLYQGQIPITASAVVLFIVCAFAATAGDLFESAVKRFFGIKDSHIPGFNVLPGHGGMLDRIDSTLWVAPIIYAYLLWQGNITLLI